MSPLEYRCNLSAKPTPLPHFWEHTVGSGHAPLALRADWQQQMRQCREQLGFRHVRFHDLLSDDMGTMMDEQDQLLYEFFNADQICDFSAVDWDEAVRRIKLYAVDPLLRQHEPCSTMPPT